MEIWRGMMKDYISITVSAVAFILSIIALAIIVPEKLSGEEMRLDFDYIGVVIGVLSFLVTVLMGYQIYTVINVKKEMEDVKQIKKDIDSTLKAKVEQLTSDNQEELGNATNVLIAMLSRDKDLIIETIFKVYVDSKPGQLARELANKSILTILEGYVAVTDEASRRASLEELSKNVKYEDVVEFYTDYAKNDNKTDFKDVETVILELLGILADNNNDGVKN